MIPSALLIQILGLNPLATQHNILSVPKDLFLFLLNAYMSQQPFNETNYLAANPDVADAVEKGDITSGLAHFLKAGYWEGREGSSADFSEEWYLQQNPDVAIAVKLGEIESGRKHYQLYGKTEWRSPSPELHQEFIQWKTFLHARKKKS